MSQINNKKKKPVSQTAECVSPASSACLCISSSSSSASLSAILFFRKCAGDSAPLTASWCNPQHNKEDTKQKVRTRIVCCNKASTNCVCACVCVCTQIHSASCQVNISLSASEDEPRLSAEQLNFCPPVNHVCVQQCMSVRNKSVCVCVLFFLYLDPSISECRSPPIGCRSCLDRPKFWRIQSLAVNREILYSLSCNTSDVSQSCSDTW